MEGRYIFYGFFILCLFHGISAIELDYVMIERMSKVKNLTDWCALMNLEDCEKALEDATPTEGVDETGQKMVVSGGDTSQIAMFDACNPREMTIALPRHPDPDITIWPTCTRAMRCGGCCTSDVFSCEPTELKETYVKVFDTRLPYQGAHRFQFLGVRTVKIIEHVQCDAQCKTKKHECHKYQTYEARKCRCVCRPERLALQSTCNEVQLWDDSECDCICPNRNTANCPEPSYFSTTTCKCTLKTSVGGEIDLDKLFEQLDKGLIGSDIRLKNGQENDLAAEHEIGILIGGQTANTTATEEKEGSPVEGTDTAGQGGGAKETSQGGGTSTQTEDGAKQPEGVKVDEKPSSTPEPAETGHGGEQQRVESTTTTPPATTTTTPQTTIPTTTKDPCAATKCFGVWKPRLLSNGRCQCFPPSPVG